MPKELEYPRKSFVQALELANAIDFLGGNTSIENAAEKLNQSARGGSFSALLSAASKHKLIEGKKGFAVNTDLYRQIKLAYNEDEKKNALRKAFLEPQVYKNIFQKFQNKELPVQMLDRILIREFQVADDIASRVAKYFIDGAAFTELLNGNKLIPFDPEIINTQEADLPKDLLSTEQKNVSTAQVSMHDDSIYLVHIQGPGMDSKMQLSDEDDFIILEAMIRKLKRKIEEKN